jgi:hypothetical protein
MYKGNNQEARTMVVGIIAPTMGLDLRAEMRQKMVQVDSIGGNRKIDSV